MYCFVDFYYVYTQYFCMHIKTAWWIQGVLQRRFCFEQYFYEAKKKMVRLLCGVSLREVVELVDVAMANYKKSYCSSWRFGRITGTIFGSFIITNPARLMVKMFKTSQLSSRIAPPGLILNRPCWSRHHLSCRI